MSQSVKNHQRDTQPQKHILKKKEGKEKEERGKEEER
tara:strand:- start:1562 stop:1672 length:111 start_codon:yes stop_codon:yes gene_type:complete